MVKPLFLRVITIFEEPPLFFWLLQNNHYFFEQPLFAKPPSQKICMFSIVLFDLSYTNDQDLIKHWLRV